MYRDLLAQLVEARRDLLFQSLVNPLVEGLVLSPEMDRSADEREDRHVSIVLMHTHAHLLHLIMREA